MPATSSSTKQRLRVCDAVAVDGEGPALEGLDQEVRHHPAVAGPQPRAVGVEDPDDADVDAVGAVRRPW